MTLYREFNYSYTGTPFTGLHLWAATGAKYDSQEILSQESTPAATAEGEDPATGTTMNYYYIPYEALSKAPYNIALKQKVVIRRSKIAVDADAIQPYDEESELYKRYTKSDWRIDPDSDAVSTTAARIVGKETNPYKKAFRIYLYVIFKMHYTLDFLKEIRTVDEILESGSGECGAYHQLFVALCRAQGIPARWVAGMTCQINLVSLLTGLWTHADAEFYVEPYGWIPVDCTMGELLYVALIYINLEDFLFYFLGPIGIPMSETQSSIIIPIIVPVLFHYFGNTIPCFFELNKESEVRLYPDPIGFGDESNFYGESSLYAEGPCDYNNLKIERKFYWTY